MLLTYFFFFFYCGTISNSPKSWMQFKQHFYFWTIWEKLSPQYCITSGFFSVYVLKQVYSPVEPQFNHQHQIIINDTLLSSDPKTPFKSMQLCQQHPLLQNLLFTPLCYTEWHLSPISLEQLFFYFPLLKWPWHFFKITGYFVQCPSVGVCGSYMFRYRFFVFDRRVYLISS